MKINPEKISQLKVKELKEKAKELNIEKISLLNKEELCYKIISESALIDGNIIGYGTLEVLPDGYGFLRNTSLEKDIYVSASQIKKFLLRTGDTVLGEIRTPTPEEKNYALKMLFLANGKSLEYTQKRVLFDDLIPYYPTEHVDEVTMKGLNEWRSKVGVRVTVEGIKTEGMKLAWGGSGKIRNWTGEHKKK